MFCSRKRMCNPTLFGFALWNCTLTKRAFMRNLMCIARIRWSGVLDWTTGVPRPQKYYHARTHMHTISYYTLFHGLKLGETTETKTDHNWSGCQILVPRLDQSETISSKVPCKYSTPTYKAIASGYLAHY